MPVILGIAIIANTVKVELVECENEKPQMIEINEKNTTNFDYNTVEVIDDLDHRQFESFIDGICYSFVSKFDSNNNYITHIARFADRPQFESLLDAYFVFG